MTQETQTTDWIVNKKKFMLKYRPETTYSDPGVKQSVLHVYSRGGTGEQASRHSLLMT